MAPKTPPPTIPTYQTSPGDVFNFRLQAPHPMVLTSKEVSKSDLQVIPVKKTFPLGTHVRVHALILPNATGVTMNNPELIRYRLETKETVTVPGYSAFINQTQRISQAFLCDQPRSDRAKDEDWNAGEVAYVIRTFKMGPVSLSPGTKIYIRSPPVTTTGRLTSTKGKAGRYYSWSHVEYFRKTVCYHTSFTEGVSHDALSPL